MDELDLSPLTRNLRLCFRDDPPVGYREGKQRIRKLLMRMYDCSSQRAGRIVARLERDGYIYARPKGPRARHEARWYFEPHPV